MQKEAGAHKSGSLNNDFSQAVGMQNDVHSTLHNLPSGLSDDEEMLADFVRIVGIPSELIQNPDFLKSLQELIKQMLAAFQICAYDLIRNKKTEQYHIILQLGEGISRDDCENVTAQVRKQLEEYGNHPAYKATDLGRNVLKCARDINVLQEKEFHSQ